MNQLQIKGKTWHSWFTFESKCLLRQGLHSCSSRSSIPKRWVQDLSNTKAVAFVQEPWWDGVASEVAMRTIQSKNKWPLSLWGMRCSSFRQLHNKRAIAVENTPQCMDSMDRCSVPETYYQTPSQISARVNLQWRLRTCTCIKRKHQTRKW